MASIRGLGAENPQWPRRGLKRLGPYKIQVRRARETWWFTRDDLAEAQRVAGLAEDDLDHGVDPYRRYEVERVAPARRGLTVREWAQTWLAAQDLDRRVRGLYAGKLENHLLGEFGSLGLGEVRHIEMRAWLTRLAREPRPSTGRPLSAGVVGDIVRIVNNLFESARIDGLIDRNPCESLKPPRVGRGTAPVRPAHLLTPADVVAVARRIATPRPGRDEPTERQLRYRDLTLLLAWTGCRPEEMQGLRRRPEEVQLLRRPAPAIVVKEPIKRARKVDWDGTGPSTEFYHGAPKSAAGARTVEIIGPVADLLAVRMAGRRPYVFSTSSGGPFHQPDFWQVFKAAARSLGHPEWTPYDLRHSHISWGDRWPQRALKERVGHAPVDVTEAYKVVSSQDRAAILVDLQLLWDEAWAAQEEGGDAGQVAGGA